MNLKNDYKVLYEVIEGSERVFYASKTGLFIDKEEIARYAFGSFKVIYQDRDHMLYGLDTEGTKVYLDAINALFTEAEDVVEDVTETEEAVEPEKTEEPEEEIEGEVEEV